MAIGDDFEVQADGDIRHVSGTATYTVLELHRWLQDLADDAAASGDDFMDITEATPSERATDNIITLNAPFNIDDTAARFLYDGSITQDGGDTIYAGLVVVGAVESGTLLQATQDEATIDWSWVVEGLNANAAANILLRLLIKVRANGADIDGKKVRIWARELSDTYAEFSMTMATGNNTAAIFTANDLNNQTASGTIDTWDDIVNTQGYQLYDISGNAVNEPYYSKWDQASRSHTQLYERTKWLARRGNIETLYGLPGDEFRGITHQFDYDGEAAGGPTELDTIAWGTSFAYDGGTGTVPAVGQYWENSTSGGVGKIVYVSPGAGATGTVVVQRETTAESWDDNDVYALLGGTGAITQAGAVTGATNAGGSGVILADDTVDTLWIQLVSGVAPANNYEIWQRGDASVRCVVNGSATARTIKPEFIGLYTGSAFIGAFGIGFLPAETVASDLFTDLTNATWNPPNNQEFTVLGLVVGDRVLVTNYDGGAQAPDFNQLALNTTLSGAAEATLVVTTAIPADTPQVGSLRVELDTGVYRYVEYDSWSGSTFQLDAAYQNWTDPNDATAGADVFIGYIDRTADATSEAVTMVFSGNRDLFVRVRDGGATPIKTFETTATFGSGGGSATAIRTSDA